MAAFFCSLKDQSAFEPDTTLAMSPAFERSCRARNPTDAANHQTETTVVRNRDAARATPTVESGRPPIRRDAEGFAPPPANAFPEGL